VTIRVASATRCTNHNTDLCFELNSTLTCANDYKTLLNLLHYIGDTAHVGHGLAFLMFFWGRRSIYSQGQYKTSTRTCWTPWHIFVISQNCSQWTKAPRDTQTQVPVSTALVNTLVTTPVSVLEATLMRIHTQLSAVVGCLRVTARLLNAYLIYYLSTGLFRHQCTRHSNG